MSDSSHKLWEWVRACEEAPFLRPPLGVVWTDGIRFDFECGRIIVCIDIVEGIVIGAGITTEGEYCDTPAELAKKAT